MADNSNRTLVLLRHQFQSGSRLLGLAVADVILALAVACSSNEPTPTPTATDTPPPTPTATVTAEMPVLETLFLEVSGPAPESVVTEETVVVRGATIPNAVVSIDGEIVDVDAQGAFAAEVTLLPGPNRIEIVASDLSGAQERTEVVVIYLAE